MDNPFDTDEWRAWAAATEAELVPKMNDSAMALTLYTGDVDIKIAVETGLAILLGKPIILCVTPGVAAPGRLVELADEIVEFDPDHPDPDAIKAAIRRVAERLDS